MERIVKLHIEKQPEGVWLATSEEIPGLVAQGRTVTETLEIARDVARKLLKARFERRVRPEPDEPGPVPVGNCLDYPLVVGGA